MLGFLRETVRFCCRSPLVCSLSKLFWLKVKAEVCSRGNPALMLLLYADDNSCSFFGKQEFAAIQIGSLQSDLAAKLVSVPNCPNLLHSIVIPTSTEQLNYAVFHKIDWSSVRGAAELDARVVKVQAVVRGRRTRQTARNRTTANRCSVPHADPLAVCASFLESSPALNLESSPALFTAPALLLEASNTRPAQSFEAAGSIVKEKSSLRRTLLVWAVVALAAVVTMFAAS
jgi:hypothetical protein